jgi:hypothetical protein
MALFRRSKHETAAIDVDAEVAAALRPGPRVEDDASLSYVPASVRGPEAHRFEMYDETDEEDNGEIEFLSALASQIDREQRGHAAKGGLPPARDNADEDTLNVFREMRQRDERTPISDALRIQHVEIGDLLDDLQTTVAALRRRRAA